MMQRILSRRERIILYATIGIIALVVIFNFALEPMLARNEQLNKDITVTRAKLKKYLQLLSEKESIQSRYATLSSRALPEGTEGVSVDVLSELEQLAKAANIRIIDIRPQNPGVANAYPQAFFELRAEGGMENYLQFIYRIENSLLLLRVTKLQLNVRPATQILEGVFLIAQISLD